MNIKENLNKFPRLTDNARLRKEKNFVLLIDNIYGIHNEISSYQAVIVTMLNGCFTLNKIIDIFASIYKISYYKATEKIKNLIDIVLEMNLLTFEAKSLPVNLFYNPESFIFLSKEEPELNKYKSPIRIEYMLTDFCNFKCNYCYMDAKSNAKDDFHFMDFNLFSKISKEANDLEVKGAFISGGEPLLVKDFPERVGLLMDHDIFPYISTNGLLLNKPLIKYLKSIDLNFIQVSLDTVDTVIFNNITRTKNNLKKVIKNIETLIENNFNVRIKAVITKKNYLDIKNLIDFCVKVGIKDLEIAPSSLSVSGRKSLSSLSLSKSETDFISNSINEIKTRNNVNKININFGNPLTKWSECKPERICGGAITSLVFFPNGDVGICDMIKDKNFIIGNSNKNSLIELWNSEKINLFRKIPQHLLNSECKDCKYIDYCRTGCFNFSKTYYDDYFAPDPNCPIKNYTCN